MLQRKVERLLHIFFCFRIVSVSQKSVSEIDKAALDEVVDAFRLREGNSLEHESAAFRDVVGVYFHVAKFLQRLHLLVVVIGGLR